MSVLETILVGQCEVFVCLDFVHFFFFLLFRHLPSLNVSLKGVHVGFGDSFCRTV